MGFLDYYNDEDILVEKGDRGALDDPMHSPEGKVDALRKWIIKNRETPSAPELTRHKKFSSGGRYFQPGADVKAGERKAGPKPQSEPTRPNQEPKTKPQAEPQAEPDEPTVKETKLSEFRGKGQQSWWWLFVEPDVIDQLNDLFESEQFQDILVKTVNVVRNPFVTGKRYVFKPLEGDDRPNKYRSIALVKDKVNPKKEDREPDFGFIVFDGRESLDYANKTVLKDFIKKIYDRKDIQAFLQPGQQAPHNASTNPVLYHSFRDIPIDSIPKEHIDAINDLLQELADELGISDAEGKEKKPKAEEPKSKEEEIPTDDEGRPEFKVDTELKDKEEEIPTDDEGRPEFKVDTGPELSSDEKLEISKILKDNKDLILRTPELKKIYDKMVELTKKAQDMKSSERNSPEGRKVFNAYDKLKYVELYDGLKKILGDGGEEPEVDEETPEDVKVGDTDNEPSEEEIAKEPEASDEVDKHQTIMGMREIIRDDDNLESMYQKYIDNLKQIEDITEKRNSEEDKDVRKSLTNERRNASKRANRLRDKLFDSLEAMKNEGYDMSNKKSMPFSSFYKEEIDIPPAYEDIDYLDEEEQQIAEETGYLVNDVVAALGPKMFKTAMGFLRRSKTKKVKVKGIDQLTKYASPNKIFLATYNAYAATTAVCSESLVKWFQVTKEADPITRKLIAREKVQCFQKLVLQLPDYMKKKVSKNESVMDEAGWAGASQWENPEESGLKRAMKSIGKGIEKGAKAADKTVRDKTGGSVVDKLKRATGDQEAIAAEVERQQAEFDNFVKRYDLKENFVVQEIFAYRTTNNGYILLMSVWEGIGEPVDDMNTISDVPTGETKNIKFFVGANEKGEQFFEDNFGMSLMQWLTDNKSAKPKDIRQKIATIDANVNKALELAGEAGVKEVIFYNDSEYNKVSNKFKEANTPEALYKNVKTMGKKGSNKYGKIIELKDGGKISFYKEIDPEDGGESWHLRSTKEGIDLLKDKEIYTGSWDKPKD